jgi:hypothetical protein
MLQNTLRRASLTKTVEERLDELKHELDQIEIAVVLAGTDPYSMRESVEQILASAKYTLDQAKRELTT